MSIACNATRSHFTYARYLLLVAAIAVSGCGGRPQATRSPGEQQQHALRQQEQPSPPPTPARATAATKPATGGAESRKALAELARTSETREASQGDTQRLKRELTAAQMSLRGWHGAYRAGQVLAVALQKAAAALNEHNAVLERRRAEAAALVDARERLAGQALDGAPSILPDAPGAAVVPPAAPTPAPAPVAFPSMPPPLGVVRDVRPFRGRPYATLSIGHDAGVRRGMRFGLADPRTGAPAGVVTVDEVGAEEAGGLVEAADPFGLRAGLAVHELADLAP
jgi:hypothetical protein